ncbi:helix-turn-helix transcriptional regulator [Slackia piriformis]|uniref:helix-turn-helix transcriptional regulator n=1 Tax=Slackia piriformis TaxID=626934 RepID=UPI0032C144EF
MHSSISTAMAMMAFAGFVYFPSDRISLNALVKSALPLTLCGFLLIPSEGFLGTVVSSYMISAGYSFMTLLIALMLYDISKRFGIMVLLLFCLKNAMQIFVVWGREEARTTLRDHLSSKHKLSPREDEILRLYAQGMNGPQIERELFIAEGTLKTHTRHIYEKLGISNRKELRALLGVK